MARSSFSFFNCAFIFFYAANFFFEILGLNYGTINLGLERIAESGLSYNSAYIGIFSSSVISSTISPGYLF